MFHDKYGKDKFGEYGGSSRWNLGGMKFRSSKKLGSWACLNIHYGQRPEQKHDTCVKNFVKVLNDCGVEASGPHTTHLSASQLNQLVSIFQNYQSSKPVIRLLLVVLPNKDSQLYNQVKRLGDLKYGIQTICVVGLKNKFYNTATNDRGELRSTQYYANVALKVNIKNDGINHVLKNDQLGFISEGETMVVGIDVTHPSPGSGPVAPSVAAMVASSDKHLAQWPAEIRINPARQEQVEMLRPMLRSHLIYWKEKHGSFPEKLLIYRDGVSEGQYQMVLDEELPQLRAACELAYGDQRPPRITLIVVGKRHHTRFYRSKITGEIIRTNEGKDGNPPFGTVSTYLSISPLVVGVSTRKISKGIQTSQCLPSLRVFVANPFSLYKDDILTSKLGRRYGNRGSSARLGFLPTVTHRPSRDRTSSTLLRPLGRDFQKPHPGDAAKNKMQQRF